MQFLYDYFDEQFEMSLGTIQDSMDQISFVKQ